MEGNLNDLSEAVVTIHFNCKFQMTLRLDLTKAEIFQEIKKLNISTSPLGQMVVLAVMGHGDENGNIKDVDGENIEVQHLVDAMQAAFPHQVKVRQSLL